MSDQNKTYRKEQLGQPLFVSRSSEVYSWEDGSKLLKLFKENVDPAMALREEINTVEAYEQGVSKVRCYGKVEVEGRNGIIIEKMPGKTLIARAMGKPGTVFAAPKLMANLQLAMHGAHGEKMQDYKDMVRESLNLAPLSFLTEEERSKILTRLAALPDGDRILHLDYHPDNIMSDGEHVTVIDWMTAAKGCPAADIAATLYLLNEGEMIPGLSKMVAAVLEKIRKSICKKYVKIYKEASGMTDEEIRPWRLMFLIVRLGIWNIDSEVDVLQKKIRDELKNE